MELRPFGSDLASKPDPKSSSLTSVKAINEKDLEVSPYFTGVFPMVTDGVGGMARPTVRCWHCSGGPAMTMAVYSG